MTGTYLEHMLTINNVIIHWCGCLYRYHYSWLYSYQYWHFEQHAITEHFNDYLIMAVIVTLITIKKIYPRIVQMLQIRTVWSANLAPEM